MEFDFFRDDNHKKDDPYGGGIANKLIEDTAAGASAGLLVKGGMRGVAIGAAAGLGYGIFENMSPYSILSQKGDPDLVTMLVDDTFAGGMAGMWATRNVRAFGVGAAAGLGYGLVKHLLVEKVVGEVIDYFYPHNTPVEPPVMPPNLKPTQDRTLHVEDNSQRGYNPQLTPNFDFRVGQNHNLKTAPNFEATQTPNYGGINTDSKKEPFSPNQIWSFAAKVNSNFKNITTPAINFSGS